MNFSWWALSWPKCFYSSVMQTSLKLYCFTFDDDQFSIVHMYIVKCSHNWTVVSKGYNSRGQNIEVIHSRHVINPSWQVNDKIRSGANKTWTELAQTTWNGSRLNELSGRLVSRYWSFDGTNNLELVAQWLGLFLPIKNRVFLMCPVTILISSHWFW